MQIYLKWGKKTQKKKHCKKHTLCIWFKIMLEWSAVPFSGIASTSHGLSFSISPLSHLQKHEVKNHCQRTRAHHPIFQFGLTWLWSTEKGCQDIRTDMVPDKLWTQTTRRHRSQSETDHLQKTKHENQDRHDSIRFISVENWMIEYWCRLPK